MTPRNVGDTIFTFTVHERSMRCSLVDDSVQFCRPFGGSILDLGLWDLFLFLMPFGRLISSGEQSNGGDKPSLICAAFEPMETSCRIVYLVVGKKIWEAGFVTGLGCMVKANQRTRRNNNILWANKKWRSLKRVFLRTDFVQTCNSNINFKHWYKSFRYSGWWSYKDLLSDLCDSNNDTTKEYCFFSVYYYLTKNRYTVVDFIVTFSSFTVYHIFFIMSLQLLEEDT